MDLATPTASFCARLWLVLLFGIMSLSASSGLMAAEEPTDQQLHFFETRIRPLLAEQCYKCHATRDPKGQLRIDSREGLLDGGQSGPALVPEDPGNSRLLRAVSYADPDLQMPPDKQLARDEVAALEQWILMGAPWPQDARRRPDSEPFAITNADRSHWSFQLVQQPRIPLVDDQPFAQPIDPFILRRLIAVGLDLNGPTAKRLLARRAYFDLIGLPPTPDEVDRYLADTTPHAYEKLIDRLLASPHYGERWARHWLDVVRFAQTNGYERDNEKPYAWRYRDYVIRALNEDKPYDQFVLEQLAGDELDEVTRDSLIATGFYHLGVWDDEPDDRRQAEYDYLDDIVQTTGAAFMGLTVSCARCHDHMFDPLPQTDYYELLAFFRNIKYYGDPEAANPDLVFRTLPDGEISLAVREHGPAAKETHVLVRGNPATPGPAVQPRFLAVLHNTQPNPVHATEHSPGLRRALAEWLVRDNHPLTARVIVNRIWQHHFGRGIVGTPNDFGVRGQQPTHPDLLDWLASDLMSSGWSIKRMHRLIMTSYAYRMSSRSDNRRADHIDPDNRLLWRQNMQRLEAESLRDATLAISGGLNRQQGGRGVFPRLSAQVLAGWFTPGRNWLAMSQVERWRRSVYIFVKRSMHSPFLEGFDYSNTSTSVGTRTRTTVAPQALMLMNSEFLQDQAAKFADRLRREAGSDPTSQIQHAYRLALGRRPTEQELRFARQHLNEQSAKFADLASRITFSPRVPGSLNKEFLEHLSGEDLLAGPRDEWRYFKGYWGDTYSGARFVDVRRGPFALLDGVRWRDGNVQGQFRLDSPTSTGGLILRGLPTDSVWHGYEFVIDAATSNVILRRHHHDVTDLAKVGTDIFSDNSTWHNFRISARAGHFQIWLDSSPDPLIDATDPNPIMSPGHFGVRTWNGSLELANLQVAPTHAVFAGPASTVQDHQPDHLLQKWQYSKGHWRSESHIGYRVDASQAAVMLWNPQEGIAFEKHMTTASASESESHATSTSYLLRCEVYTNKITGYAGILFGVENNADDPSRLGGFLLRLSESGLELGRYSEGQFHELGAHKMGIERGWHMVRVWVDGNKIRAGVHDSLQPRIAYEHDRPVGMGRFGFLAHEMSSGLRNFQVSTGDRKWILPLADPSPHESPLSSGSVIHLSGDITDARHAALESLCIVLFNLNEFVYID